MARRNIVSRRACLGSVTAAFLGLAALPTGASAALVEPPPLPHIFTVFPDRDFVSVEGYDPGEALTVRVMRNGVTIGTAGGNAGPDGIFEVNHPGGACWDASTPNIMSQDKVVVAPTGSAADVGEATTTADVQATQAVDDGAGRIVIHGTARNADGSPMDLGLTEQRIVNPDFLNVGLTRRDIRAVSDGSGNGTLTADPIGPGNPDGTHWTVVYSGLTQAQRDAAVAGQTRMLAWQSTNAAGDRLGITIHEVGEVGGPGFGGCPQRADYAVTSSAPSAVTKATSDAGTALALSGVSQDATAVSVTLSDKDSNTPDLVGSATLGAATGAQTWNVTFAPEQVATLTDGTLTATGTYSVGGGTVNGTEKTLEKDIVAPGAPDATPGTGTYATGQSVTLDKPDPASVIHYTANGTEPSAASPVAPAQLHVTSSQTIKAIAIDPVGNPSTVSTFVYTILGGGPVPGGGAGPGATGTGGQPASGAAAAARGTAPAGVAARPAPFVAPIAPIVAGVTARSLTLGGMTLSNRISATRLRIQGLRVSMRVPAGARVLRFAIYRARSGRPAGQALAVGYRLVSRTGTVRLVLRDRALVRRLKPGRYALRVQPGSSRSDLGTPTTAVFTVTA
ncbi:MAG: hypothetical protein QOH46_3867 [Solirubrobacteraceae bacterium]|nr:hypothetical protein [Solirubrobacteraceae bacterium]